MGILLVRFNMPIDTLNSLNHLIQSKKAHERHNGLNKLILLLKNTQINNEKSKIKAARRLTLFRIQKIFKTNKLN